MANEPSTASTASPSLQATHVYALALVCMVAGLAIGYLLRGSPSPASPALNMTNAPSIPGNAMGSGQLQGMRQAETGPARSIVAAAPPSAHAGAMDAGHMPSMEQMRQMADGQAAPVLEKLKSHPNDSALLVQAGGIYHTAHQFKEAAVYFDKAARIEPRNVVIRNKLASSLYRGGDVDGAIAELNRALAYDPKDANSLFNLGTIKLQGKRDGKGALAAWQQLLNSNPQLSADRKALVLKLMADVQTTLGDQHGITGAHQK